MPTDFYTPTTEQKAAKRHRCDVCSAYIEVGTIYARWSGRYDGGWFTCTVHRPCLAFANHDRDGDEDLPQVSNWNTDEALMIFQEVGVLVEALPYLRTVMDFTDTEFDGKTDEEIVTYCAEQVRLQLEQDLERIGRQLARGNGINGVWGNLRDVAFRQGLWKNGALTEKGEALAAQYRQPYRAVVVTASTQGPATGEKG